MRSCDEVSQSNDGERVQDCASYDIIGFAKDNLFPVGLSSQSKDFVKHCRECNKGFKSLCGYKLHVKMQHSSKGIESCPKCLLCGKLFQSESHLKVHQRSHSAVKPFVCNLCGKSYKHKKDLNMHICK